MSSVATLTESIPKLVETGASLLLALITDLPRIIREIAQSMPEIIAGMTDTLIDGISDFEEIGANLVRGLWDGIQSLAGWLWGKVSDWISSIWDGITDFFGIASPSKQMAWVGEMLVEGLAGSLDTKGRKAVTAVDKMALDMISEVESEMAKVHTALADSVGEIETSFSAKAAIAQVSTAVPSLLPVNTGESIFNPVSSPTKMVFQFHIDTLSVRDDSDVEKVAQQLYYLTEQKRRSRGGGSL